MNLLRISMLAAVLAVAGCGGGPKPIQVQPPAAANAKATLQEVAQTGQLGSGMMQVRENLQQIKQTDAAKGNELLSELDALEKATDPETIKAKAKAMADKL